MALRRRLESGSPARMAGPVSPPRSSPARESSRRPAFTLSGPWQGMQLATRTGRIFFSKTSASSGTSRARAATSVSMRRYTVYRLSYTRQASRGDKNRPPDRTRRWSGPGAGPDSLEGPRPPATGDEVPEVHRLLTGIRDRIYHRRRKVRKLLRED